MSQEKKKECKEAKEAIEKYLAEHGADGWGILYPEPLIAMGFSEPFVKAHTSTMQSGKSYKETIFDAQGNRVNSMKGVYALEFLYAIANNIEADKSEAQRKSGRGFQAGCLCQAIHAKLNPVAVNVA